MPAGRPTKLTPELQEKIIQAISAGNYIEVAAQYCGVDKATLYVWLKRGARASGGIYRRFNDSVQKALSAAEVRDVTLIAKAAEADWKASAWRLERKFPDRWGHRSTVAVIQKLANDMDGLTDEQLLAIAGGSAGESRKPDSAGDPAAAGSADTDSDDGTA